MTIVLTGCSLGQKTNPASSSLTNTGVTTQENTVTPGLFSTQETTGTETVTKGEDIITRLSYDEKINGFGTINGNSAAWQESNGGEQHDTDIILFNLSSKEKYRIGLEKNIFGNTVGMKTNDFTTVDSKNQRLPQLSNDYIIWVENDKDS